MKDALKRYLLGMNSGLCFGAMLLTIGMLAVNWFFRGVWMAMDMARTPMGWILEQHPTWKFALLTGVPSVVGLLIIWVAFALMSSGAKTIQASDRPWGAVYGTTFFFIAVQALMLGWMWFLLFAWPPTEPPKPEVSASPSASPSPGASPSPDASASPSASPSPGLKNPFGNNPSASPSASPAVATDPFRPNQPSQPIAGMGSGRYVEFFDGLTLTVEREVDLSRSSTPRQFGCRDGILFWADGEHVTAVNLTTGASQWRISDAEGEDEVQATVSGLVLTRAQGKTIARRSSNGEVAWTSGATILVDGDRLFQVAADEAGLGQPLQGQCKVVQRLDPQTGKGKGEAVHLKLAVDEPQIDSGLIVGHATEPNNFVPVQDTTTGDKLWATNDVGPYLARSGRLYSSVEKGTVVRELRTGKPLAAGHTIPGSVVASFSGGFVMNDPETQELAAYDPATGVAQWGWKNVQSWPLTGRDGMMLQINENGAMVLLAYDGKGQQLYKGPLDASLAMRAVVGAKDNQAVLLVEKAAASPSPAP